MINSLLITCGSDTGKSFPLTHASTTIGRDPENTICIDDDEVSRFHCTISTESGQLFLIDEASSNGTIVNRRRIQRCPLQRGDRIQIGQTHLVFDGFLEIADTPELSELSGTFTLSDSDTLFLDSVSESGSESTYREVDSSSDQGDAGRRFVRAHNDLRFIYDASLTTSRNVDTPKMLGDLMDLIFEWIQADRGCVMLTYNNGKDFTTVVVKTRNGGDAPPEIHVNQAIVDYVCQQKVGVMSPNTMVDSRWRLEKNSGNPTIAEMLCVPIQGRSELLGVIYVDSLHRSTTKSTIWFTEDHLRMVLAIAHQAAVAIENKSYFSALIEKERMAAVGEITALMSHRINNILQGINGGSHLVEAGMTQSNPAILEKGWDIVRKNQEQISQLLMDLMFVSKPFHPEKVKTDILKLVNVAIEKFNSATESCPMECRVQCELDNPDARVESESLIESIVNILMIISDATQLESKPTCEINVELDGAGSFFKIEFRYEGSVICLKMNEELSRTLRPESQTLGGIGFEVSQKIAYGHGGEIVISSKGPSSHRVTMTLERSLDTASD